MPKYIPEACRMIYLTEMPSAKSPAMLAGYPDLLTVQHMSEITGLSKQTIRKEITEGRLPGCKVGRRLFVSKFKFIEYVNGGKSEG